MKTQSKNRKAKNAFGGRRALAILLSLWMLLVMLPMSGLADEFDNSGAATETNVTDVSEDIGGAGSISEEEETRAGTPEPEGENQKPEGENQKPEGENQKPEGEEQKADGEEPDASEGVSEPSAEEDVSDVPPEPEAQEVTESSAAVKVENFEPLPDELRFQRGEPTLPETVEGVVNGEKIQIPVTWAAEDYEKGDVGLYVFIAEPAEGYKIADGVSAPRVTAMIPKQENVLMGVMRAITFGRVTGIGTENDPLILTNADQLAELATLVNAGALESFIFGSHASEYQIHIDLGADIDLSGYGVGFNESRGWIPIGMTTTNFFKGVFDGKEHTITGLYINGTDTEAMGPGSGWYRGLFGVIGNSEETGTPIEVKNLRLENVNVTGYSYVGGVAGSVQADGVIENCSVSGDVTGVGVITGSARRVGGVVGGVENGGRLVNDRHETGTVKGVGFVGGVVGWVYRSDVTDCHAKGNVSGTSEDIGGVVGYVQNGSSVTNCSAAGDVTGTGAANENIGGVVGGINSSPLEFSFVENCYATGAVNGRTKVGGVAGWVQDGSSIKNSYATGDVTGSGDYVGGVAGQVAIVDEKNITRGSSVASSYATGAVTGSGNYVGGVVGQVSGTDSSVANSYATGAVAGKNNYVGGVAGAVGIVGSNSTNSNVSVANSYATGEVRGNGYVGGVAGRIPKGGSVTNCAALNPSVILTSISAATTRRVAGSVDSGGELSGSFAFSGMLVTKEGASNTIGEDDTEAGENNLHGLSKSAEAIINEGIFSDLGFSEDEWNLSEEGTGKLPTLKNVVNESLQDGAMPAHIRLEWEAAFKGKGTPEEPYEIGTREELVTLSNLVMNDDANYNDKNYILTANIDLSSIAWIPIGTMVYPFDGMPVHPFKGVFNGDGKTISGLSISNTYHDYAGLFGYISGTEANPARVENLGVENANINAGSYVGGVAGYVGTYAEIENCYVTGTIKGGRTIASTTPGTFHIGGVAGYVDSGGSVTNSYATGAVTGTSSVSGTSGVRTITINVGGVAGYVDSGGSVTSSYATGAVTGTSTNTVAGSSNKIFTIYAGGVAGYVNSGGSVTSSYATGAITGTNKNTGNGNSNKIFTIYAGGVAGSVAGNVTNCAALNPSMSFSTTDEGTNTTSSEVVGRVAGVKDDGGTLSGNIAFSGMTVKMGDEDKTISDGAGTIDGLGKIAADLQTKVAFPLALTSDPWTYRDEDQSSNKLPGLNGDTVAMPSHLANSALNPEPEQDLEPEQEDPVTSLQGGGTASDPYLISIAADLAFLAEKVNAGESPYADNGQSFKLTGDIVFDYGKDWTPIGTADNPFAGHFDGAGKTVSGLYINDDTLEYAGLFGKVTGTVRLLGVTNANVRAGNNAGVIAGELGADGVIEQCYVTGTVTGAGNAGGVVGSAAGTVENCYAMGAVASTAGNAGGIAGSLTAGSIKNCYATNEIKTASGSAGGIVGAAASDTEIENCVALNRGVTANTSIGRITGSAGGTLDNNRAFDAMKLSPIPDEFTYNKGASRKHGEDVYEDDNTVGGAKRIGFYNPNFWSNPTTGDLFTGGMGWDSINIWSVAEESEHDRLPTLMGLSGQTGDAGIYDSGQYLRFADADITYDREDFTYTGEDLTSAVKVKGIKFGTKDLAQDVDYKVVLTAYTAPGSEIPASVTPQTAVSVGAYTFKLVGCGDYVGEIEDDNFLFEITQIKTATATAEHFVKLRGTAFDDKTMNLSEALTKAVTNQPDLGGNITFDDATVTDNISGLLASTDFEIGADKSLTLPIAGTATVGDTATVTVSVKSTNYANITLTIIITAIARDTLYVDADPQDRAYNGETYVYADPPTFFTKPSGPDGPKETQVLEEGRYKVTYAEVTGDTITELSDSNPPTNAGNYAMIVTLTNVYDPDYVLGKDAGIFYFEITQISLNPETHHLVTVRNASFEETLKLDTMLTQALNELPDVNLGGTVTFDSVVNLIDNSGLLKIPRCPNRVLTAKT